MTDGEFEMIDRIAAIVGASGDILAGIGDDAAVLEFSDTHYLLATIDMQVQGVHFRTEQIEPEPLGRRAMAVNISDIAAMGGEPRHALVSLAIPPNVTSDWVDALYRGMVTEARRFECAVVGGNLARIDGPIAIDIATLGRVPCDEVVLRSGATVGDLVAVTGTLGDAAALRLARDRGILTGELQDELPQVPQPRVGPGRGFARSHIATSMIDVSDGLAADILHVCGASGVSIVLRAGDLPVGALATRLGPRLGIDPLELALSGGEDYELAITLAPNRVEEAIEAAGNAGLLIVGEIVSPEQVNTLIQADGSRIPLVSRGWRHF